MSQMLEKEKSKIVFTNGCFDLLHVGHFNLLNYCRKLAGEDGKLFVGLDSDKKVKEDKGVERPFFSYLERKCALESLTRENGKVLIDKIHAFHTNEELLNLIKITKPDIIVKGSDWKDQVIGSELSEVKVFQKNKYSSSSISKRILEKSLQYDFRNEIILSSKQPYSAIVQCTCTFKINGDHSDDCYSNNHMKELYKK